MLESASGARATSNGQDAAPKAPAFKRPDRPFQFRNPASDHIPDEYFVPRMAKDFPFRAIGCDVVIIMMQAEEIVTPSGVIIPAFRDWKGLGEENCVGMVVAIGPGGYSYGCYISPEHDYDIRVEDMIAIEPGAGRKFKNGNVEYRKVTPDEIMMVGRREFHEQTRLKMRAAVAAQMAEYMVKRDRAIESVRQGDGDAPTHYSKTLLEESEASLAEVEDMRARKARGTKTVLFDTAKSLKE